VSRPTMASLMTAHRCSTLTDSGTPSSPHAERIDEGEAMARLVVGREGGSAVSLYYEDFGAGAPVVLVHGWPLDLRSWELQVQTFVGAGYRVIAYDRRGFGRSTAAWSGYDAETARADLGALLGHLRIREACLIGFSSGCGDVVRLAATRDGDRIRRLVLGSPLVGTDSYADLIPAARSHRIAMLDDLLNRFVSVDGQLALDEPTRRYHLQAAAAASAIGTVEAIRSWATGDMLADLRRIDIPVLVVHGSHDAFSPYERSGALAAHAARQARAVVILDAPHLAPVTHAAQWNEAVLTFIGGMD
jgi:non-heme chloroperoxidase